MRTSYEETNRTSNRSLQIFGFSTEALVTGWKQNRSTKADLNDIHSQRNRNGDNSEMKNKIGNVNLHYWI